MTADRLLANFDRIADAPDAVPRLRRFILDLAVRGKLVEQDPNDEPASELVKRTTKENAQLAEAEGIRAKPRRAVQIKRESMPFVPPPHWCWVHLINIARTTYGFAFPSQRFNSTKRGTPLIRIRDISKADTEAYFDGDYDPHYIVQAGDYLVGMDGKFNLRRWSGKDGLLNQRVMRINCWKCHVNPDFVKLPLQFVLDHLHGATSLSTVKHLSARQVNGIEIPLPPVAEQHRIVAKVDELMALCDRLESARMEREATRDRLAAASLDRLNAPDPDPATFRDHAAFALDNLTPLTTRRDQIKAVRQTILNLAVRGKLEDQDPNDEPASELLKRIAAEKARLVKEGTTKLRKIKAREREKPIDLSVPPGWELTELGVVAEKITDGAHKTPTYVEEGVPFVSVKDFSGGILDLSNTRSIPSGEHEVLYQRCDPRRGDILIGRIGTLGKAIVVDTDGEGRTGH